MADLSSLLSRARRGYLRYRRWLVAVAAAGATLAVVHELAPPQPDTTPVVVAAHDLAAGQRLSADDLSVAQVASGSAPGVGWHSIEAVVGEHVAGPVAEGEAVTRTRVVGDGLLERLGPGVIATPVRLPDADIVALLQAGDEIDVYAATGDPTVPAAVVVRAAPVLVVPERADESRAQGAVVVLALTESEAAELAQAAATTQLSIALRGGATVSRP